MDVPAWFFLFYFVMKVLPRAVHIPEIAALMIANYLRQISHDFASLSFITFILLYLTYTVVVQAHVYSYKKKYDSKPIHYKTFRLYSKSLITNSPSKKEKRFYQRTNKITYFFNAVLVTAFAVYLFICFFR